MYIVWGIKAVYSIIPAVSLAGTLKHNPVAEAMNVNEVECLLMLNIYV